MKTKTIKLAAFTVWVCIVCSLTYVALQYVEPVSPVPEVVEYYELPEWTSHCEVFIDTGFALYPSMCAEI